MRVRKCIIHCIESTIFLPLLFLFALSQPSLAVNQLTNPDFETGTTEGWSGYGCTINSSTTARSGNYSALVSNRTATWNGIAQSLLGDINDDQTCSITGWVRIQNATSADVKITIKQTDDAGTKYHYIVGSTVSDSGWTNLSGFFTLQVTGTLTDLLLYFELPPAGVNFYVDDVSVVATDSGNWEAEADSRIEQIRKGDFRITAVAPNNPEFAVPDIDIQIVQTRHHFAFGSAMSRHHMDNTDYLNFFKDHFEWAVCENASKWYHNEPSEDYVTYENADNMFNFCAANDIKMRGHCIFWAAQNTVQDWVQALDYAPLPATSGLRTAVEDRLNSAVNHFKGKFLHWDVNNEMCNNAFYADRLGVDIRPWMFQAAAAIDPNCMLFLNDYNVISGGYNLSDFKQMAYDLTMQGAPIHGLGVQCHMSSGFSPATIKARFDSIAETGLPIWVTEFDIVDPNVYSRADQLEDFYRVAFSHPAVEGILMWGFWEDALWRENAHLVNSDWTLNAAGLRYQDLMNEWTTLGSGITDIDGGADFRGFYGTYTVTLTPNGADPTVTTIEVLPESPSEFILQLTDMTDPATCQDVRDFGYRLVSDLNGNCYTDFSDLVVLGRQWLSSTPEAIPPDYSPDIVSDNQVTILDLIEFSNQWLMCNNPQEIECTENW